MTALGYFGLKVSFNVGYNVLGIIWTRIWYIKPSTWSYKSHVTFPLLYLGIWVGFVMILCKDCNPQRRILGR